MTSVARRGSRLLPGAITLVVVIGGITWLFWSSAGEAFEYYKHVDEVMNEPLRWEQKRMQLHGFVVPDTIAKRMDKDHQQIEYKFIVQNCDRRVEVRYSGTVPDTFKDRAEVVLKGKLQGTVFHAQEVSAKCPSKYEAKNRDNPAMTMCTRGDKNETSVN